MKISDNVSFFSVGQIQIKFYLLKTRHIWMQQVVKAVDQQANKAQKSTYSDRKSERLFIFVHVQPVFSVLLTNSLDIPKPPY